MMTRTKFGFAAITACFAATLWACEALVGNDQPPTQVLGGESPSVSSDAGSGDGGAPGKGNSQSATPVGESKDGGVTTPDAGRYVGVAVAANDADAGSDVRSGRPAA